VWFSQISESEITVSVQTVLLFSDKPCFDAAGRVDNVFGDRNLVCTNPSVEVIDEKIAAAA
jgi:hypothetical protein